MDPITVVGLLAAVAQLIDITSKVVNYVNDVKDAPKDRAKLAREAAGLLVLFTDLRCRVEEISSTDPWFAGLQSLGANGGPLMEFQSAMEDIADKLVPAKSGVKFKRVLCWTLDRNEINSILSKIERLKSLIGLALQKDHFQLSLAIKEQITMRFQETKMSRDAEKIRQWLAAPNPSSNHNDAMRKRQPRTGEWFTQSKEFADWKIETSSFIWIHGIPGCGKTILCSTIIQDVISHYQSKPKIGVAYFYLDFNDLDKQRTEKLIRSLIVQLLARCGYVPELLQSAYSQSQNGQTQPTTEDLTVILCQVLEIFDSTYILLDALDECTDREELLKFIEALMDRDIKYLHIISTSRKKNDITMSLEPLVTCQLCIQSALIDADIRVHILEKLSNDPKLQKWPINVQKEIEDALMSGANGMFRWVVCQLDNLRKCFKLDALRKALNTLPKTLDDTYERILSNIDQDYQEDALRIFQWLCFSARPMRLDEMVEVLAIDLTPEFCFRPEQRFPDPRDILTICSTLVSVTAAAQIDPSTQATQTQELKLAHFSVKEYLISERLKRTSMHRYHITPLSANVAIAKTCLTYLLHFKSPTILTANFDHEFPLIKYAAEFWTLHYRSIIDDANRKSVDFLGYDLVESKESCFLNWLRIFNPDRPWRESNLNLETDKIFSPLYYMSHLGVTGDLKMLLQKGANVNAQGGRFHNALLTAARKGYEEVVRLLLDKGADVNAEGGEYGNALLAASFSVHEGVMRLLLEKGAKVNAEGGNSGNALSEASRIGHEKAVRLLLENGANVNAKGGTYGNALLAASRNGHKEVVQLLMWKRANVNAEYFFYGNALSAASLYGHKSVVRLLLEKGANVNAEGGEFGNALSAASFKGHEGVIRLLLENGANVNAKGGEYGNALSAASFKGHEGVVRLLLENGANVNAEGREFGNALSAAFFRGHEGVARLLLENGANVNAEGGEFGNALSAASFRGHEGVIRLLLENGANVNAKGGEYGNALSAASFKGHEGVVRLLLENGANVNAEGREYGNALSAALFRGHKGVVQLLLENGANVNGEGGEYGNALSAASFSGHESVVRFLLEEGANVNAQCGEYGSALSTASFQGHEKVVQLLLDKGADVNEKNGRALRKASQNGQELVLQLLLKNGANVSLLFDDQGEALRGISGDDHEAVIPLLLEKLGFPWVKRTWSL